MENILNSEWAWLPLTFIYLLNAIVILAIGRMVFNRMNRRINVSEELVIRDNFAFAVTVTGYYVGLIIAFGGILHGTPLDLLTDTTNHTAYGILAIILLNISSWINDKLILFQFKVEKEIIKDRNTGTGVIEAANYIASGILVYGAVSGEVTNLFPQYVFGHLLSGIISILVFWSIGQVILVITSRIYHKMLPFDVHAEIEKDNEAAGLGFAGVLIAAGILVANGIAGDFDDWTDHFSLILTDGILGIILLPIMRWITDKVLLPGQDLNDEIANQDIPNNGAGLIEAMSYIGGAFLIALCL